MFYNFFLISGLVTLEAIFPKFSSYRWCQCRTLTYYKINGKKSKIDFYDFWVLALKDFFLKDQMWSQR